MNLTVTVERGFNKQYVFTCRGLRFLAVRGRDDQRPRSGIREVELELIERVGRIQRRGGAHGRSRKKRDDRLESVWQSHCDPVAAAQSELVESGGDRLYLPSQLIVGDNRPASCDGDCGVGWVTILQ